MGPQNRDVLLDWVGDLPDNIASQSKFYHAYDGTIYDRYCLAFEQTDLKIANAELFINSKGNNIDSDCKPSPNL